MKKMIMLLCVLIIIAGCCPGCCGYVTARGEKKGTIIKLAKEGIIFKTWEAEMVRGGMANGSGSFSTTPFYFTIDDKSLLQKIRASLDDQKEIKIEYKTRKYIFNTNSECDGDQNGCNFLTGVN